MTRNGIIDPFGGLSQGIRDGRQAVICVECEANGSRQGIGDGLQIVVGVKCRRVCIGPLVGDLQKIAVGAVLEGFGRIIRLRDEVEPTRGVIRELRGVARGKLN